MNPGIRNSLSIAAFALAALFNAAVPGDASATRVDTLTEANIIRLTASLLGGSQFAHRPLDDARASAFLDRYLDALDGERLLFLRSDLTEFAAFRATLARDTLRTGAGQVAHVVYGRFLKRLAQHSAYVAETLGNAVFDFTDDSVYSLDRSDAARPEDLASARELWWQRLRFDYLQEKLAGKSTGEIVATLESRARRRLQMMRQADRDEVLEIYLSALAQEYDPHSDYLGRKQMSEFAISMNLSLAGIGAKLRSVDGHCEIVELIPGGPAIRGGQLRPGDRIVAVAQGSDDPVDVVDMPLARIVELIRGPKGSAVTLTIVAADAAEGAVRKSVRLMRDEIRLEEQRASAKILDLPSGGGATLRLGVIDLPSFYADLDRARDASAGVSATADVARLLDKMNAEDVRGVVLDLRRNGGGSLPEAIRLTGLFITEGPVVQTRAPEGGVDIEFDRDPAQLYGGPLVVLTSRLSASASEILAGALQDYGRAIIVGDASTFGKGTVQSVVPLAPLMDRTGLEYTYDPGALTVTIRKFYRPSGSSTQLEGVVPDIVVPSPSDTERFGESALDNPLPWDAVPPADYERRTTIDPYLAPLRTASARRVSNAESFEYIRAEMARLRDFFPARVVSLNESARRLELARLEESRTKHETAIGSLLTDAPVTYDITVGNSALDGLPPPHPGGSADRPESRADAPPRFDAVLDEAIRILADYTTLRGNEARPTTQRSAVVVDASDSRGR